MFFFDRGERRGEGKAGIGFIRLSWGGGGMPWQEGKEKGKRKEENTGKGKLTFSIRSAG